MTDLPPGFVLQPQPTSTAGVPALPEGFQIEGAAAAEPHKFGWEDTWPVKAAKAVYSGLTLPGDVAQGNVKMTGEDGHTNPDVIGRSWEAASSGLVGSPIALSHAAGAVAAPAREALSSAANAGYEAARNMGVELAPKAISDIGTKISAKLADIGITDELAPKTYSLLKKIAEPPEDSIASIGNVDALRRAFGHATSDFSNPTEQLAGHLAKDHIDSFLSELPAGSVLKGDGSAAAKILEDARGNYGAAKRSELVADELEKADRGAAVANSGQNIGNKERQSLNSVINSDKKSAGFNPDEIAKMDQVARGSPLGNATRVLGNMLGGGGGMGAAVTAGIGAAATPHLGFVGAAAPLVGVGLKKLSDATVKRGIQQLDEMVRSRSPLAQTLAEAAPKRIPMSAPAMVASRAAMGRVPELVDQGVPLSAPRISIR